MPAAPVPPGAATASPEPDETDHELSEQESLVAWEFLQCLELGFDIDQSTALIAIPHFTWHEAERLLKKGWPHATIVDEFT